MWGPMRSLLPFSFFALPCAAPTTVRVAGSSTVFPVVNAWAEAMNLSSEEIRIAGGGSSAGARRVCLPRDDPEHVDIGDMSREWKNSEALLLDDAYTWECVGSKNRVTQIEVGVDGLAVVVGKNTIAHDCLTSPEVGGLTLAMLHWIYSNWTNDQLADYGLNMASVIHNDDGDNVKEWSDISSQCDEVPINAYGPGSDSGTFDFFAETALCKDCLAGKPGYRREDFNWCPDNDQHALEHASALKTYMANGRPPNCYMASESDYQLVQWLTADPGGISYFGYAYYSIFAGELSTVRIASDRFLGVQETADAKVEPSTYTITDGSYSVFKRKLYVNVDNTAWDYVHPFLAFGFSSPGQALVSSVGYIRTNVARLAKMRARIAERGNDEADYVSIKPDTCPLGTELSAVPYVNQFGNPKTSYNCTLCPLGKFKFLDTPTPCTSCEGGKYTDVVGQTACQRCQVGFEAVDGLFCRACQPGFYKKETAAASCSPCSAGSFSNQSAQSDCLYCPPGHFSLQGSTTCAPCPINEMASFPGTTQCAQCGEGFFTTQEASTSCSRCGSGRYRSNESACLQCPGRMTTQYLAATTISDCVCPEGTVFNGDGRPGAGACENCMEGLDCILGSDLRNYESFLVGSDKELTFPRLIPGYISYPSEPTQVYKCGKNSHCPGGVPGTCARGRIGLACARCQAGQKFGVDHCKDCEPFDLLSFVASSIVTGCALPMFYYFMNSPMTAKASTILSTTMAFGMTLTLLQTIGLVGLVSLDWPSYMQPLMDFVSIFMLDLESLNFDCLGFSSAVRYCISVACWPGALLWLVACSVVSQLGPRRFRFAVAKLLSTIGQVFQIGFTIMSKTALMPFMCFSHPNGKSSVLRFTDVICWEGGEHSTMAVFGGLMTAIMAMFWAILLWAVLQAPRRSTQGDAFFLQATRFLFFRFRGDYWWYGAWFILRGPLLSLPVVVFTDVPAMQLLTMTAVLMVYMVIQLVAWPWKTPLINVADGAMSMMMILLLFIGSAFLDRLRDGEMQTYSVLAMGVLGMLYSVAFVLLCLVGLAFISRSAMGSKDELSILTLGKPPSNSMLMNALDAFCLSFGQADRKFLEHTIDELSAYDRRKLAAVLTTLAPYFDEGRMHLAHQLSVSTTSYNGPRKSLARMSTSTSTLLELEETKQKAEMLAVAGREEPRVEEPVPLIEPRSLEPPPTQAGDQISLQVLSTYV
ncbi:unnamed protein product [Effrenium voratum]|uniref:Tyrosine-protein kinase ephrin type A/B receptor-like domain-containing protein n=1 Tax=Effrenium voratum TaxID=2562239 RepID=A0AA36IPT3_9DINO|nr:unnamed protein product [Effrenium voratum]